MTNDKKPTSKTDADPTPIAPGQTAVIRMTDVIVVAHYCGIDPQGQPCLSVVAKPRYRFCERVAASLGNVN